MRSAASAWCTALIAAALGTGCMPEFVWVPATAGGSGGGGAGAVGGAGGAAGGAPTCDGGAPPVCTGSPVGAAMSGPYGAAKLYFGVPEVDTGLSSIAGQHGGAISVNGTRYVRTWTQYDIAEDVRGTPIGDWESQTTPENVVWDLFPRLTRDNRGLLSCHGGIRKCMLHRRLTPGHPFDSRFDHYFQNSSPFDGPAVDSCFTPSADNAVLAFCSTRVGPDDDSDGPLDRMLWTASAVDPADLTQGFSNLQRHDLTHVDGWDDEPTWVADDGKTVLFQSRRDGDSDLWVTHSSCDSDALGAPVKIAELSAPGSEERHLTLPSIAALRDFPCNAGWAYFHRSVAVDRGEVWRVPVCEGAPCQP